MPMAMYYICERTLHTCNTRVVYVCMYGMYASSTIIMTKARLPQHYFGFKRDLNVFLFK